MAQRSLTPRYHHLLALLLVGFSFFMSALVSRTVFERLPHLEDEVAYLYQARIFARGHLVIESPQPRQAYWQPFLIDHAGNRFGKYTPGWPALLATGVMLGQPWVVNGFLTALTVALVYRLGRELFDPDTGAIAAALTAFSPMALLLDATLMGHTAALCFTTLFLYAYWRMERGQHAGRWGIVAGFALGMVVINRPLTAVGIAAPLVAWSGIRVFRMLIGDLKPNSLFPASGDEANTSAPITRRPATQLTEPLAPLLVLAGATLLISITIPIFNYAATGDPTTNLYTLVWSYDKVGFGPEYGRNGHTLEKGIRQARFDLSLMAADLYGWQLEIETESVPFGDTTIAVPREIRLGGFTPAINQHLLTEGDYFPNMGISWILLPFGLMVGRKQRWTWLLAAVALALITVHLAYWIGSQRYSTRYYFESLTALSLLSALPLAWLARRTRPWAIYGLLSAALLYSLYAYSQPRIVVLHGFNEVGQDDIEAVLARRADDRPILVIVSGSPDVVRWRAFGSLMAVTSPYLDSDIVVAWDRLTPGMREEILARFPDRQVIAMAAEGNESWFLECGLVAAAAERYIIFQTEGMRYE